jgi:hypothetical protein
MKCTGHMTLPIELMQGELEFALRKDQTMKRTRLYNCKAKYDA